VGSDETRAACQQNPLWARSHSVTSDFAKNSNEEQKY